MIGDIGGYSRRVASSIEEKGFVNMIKVLIVDDEKKVCQLIVNLIDWEELGFEVVGVMNDGVAAYKFIQKNTVDVLITDIRMPGCDGMELIRKVKILYPNMFVAIISGYGQFDYAQNAIKYGVSDYLLKPIRKKDLMTMLRKILVQCEEKISSKERIEKLEQKLEENQQRVKLSFLEDVMKHPEKFGGYYVREKINYDYHCRFGEGYYRAMIVKIIMNKNKEDVDTKRILLKRCCEMIQNSLECNCQEMLVCVVDDEVCGLFNGTLDSMERVKRRLKKIRMELLQIQDIQLYIAIGSQKESISRIEESFFEARELLQDRFYAGNSFLLYKKTKEIETESVDQYVTNEFRKRFLGYLEILDLEDIAHELDKIQEQLIGSRAMSGRLVLEVYKAIVTLFYFGAQSYNISVYDQYEELMLYLEASGSIEDVMSYLKNYIIHSLQQWMDERRYEEAKPIRIAKKYINDNYNTSLTLEIVSREIGFNPTYFSTMFKKETGMNFTDYLKKIRVENAKNMLLHTEWQVDDISLKVGYADVKYFSKLFKKFMGVTPTEFRKLYK